MRETWYVLEDGTPVHPSEVTVNAEGRLAHKKGLIAMRDDGETPRSRGVEVDGPFGGKGDHDDNGSIGGAKKPAAKDRQMKPAKTKPAAPKKPYETR